MPNGPDMQASPTPRRTLKPPLRVGTVPIEGGRPRFMGYASDLSETGVFVQTLRPRDIGERVRVVLFASGAPNGILCADAEVRWLRGYSGTRAPAAGMGLAFVNLGKVERSFLRGYCAEHGEPLATHHVLD